MFHKEQVHLVGLALKPLLQLEQERVCSGNRIQPRQLAVVDYSEIQIQTTLLDLPLASVSLLLNPITRIKLPIIEITLFCIF